MSPEVVGQRLGFRDAQAYERARRVLRDAGYTAANVRTKLGRYLAPVATDLPVWVERTRAGEPIDQLIRLFLIGLPLPEADARHALAPTELQIWAQAGLVRRVADQVVANVSLTPHEDIVVASDWCGPLHPKRADDAHAPHVIGVGPSSLLLAGVTIRDNVQIALDIGCGSGIQALLMARHARRVIGSDFNPRALHMAKFNAKLNDIANVHWVHGSFLEPFARETFDLIVSVPPYVISPDFEFRYRDGGVGRDEVCRHLVRRSAAHLKEGGFCQMLCQWVHLRDEPPEQRLSSWFDGIGCDAWVMKMQTDEPARYAATWCAAHESDAPALLERCERWLTYFQREGIEAISSGMITLRRRHATSDRPNWTALRNAPDQILRPCGSSVAALFQARDLLDSLDERSLLQLKLRCAAGIRVAQELPVSHPEADGATGSHASSPNAMRLILSGDWIYSCRTDPRVAELIARCDGNRTLKAVLAELNERWGAGADVENLLRACMPIIRELVEFGALIPTAP